MAACNKETLQILKLTSQGYISLLWNFKFHKSVGIFLYTIQIWLDSIDNFCMHTWLDSISNFCIQIWSVFVSNFCIAYKPDQILTVILYTLQTWSESVSNLCIPYKPGQILSVIFVFLTNLVRICQLFLYSLQTWSESELFLYSLQTWSDSVSNFCIPYKPGQILSVIFVYLTNLVRIWQ